jgi:hypothetical protein
LKFRPRLSDGILSAVSVRREERLVFGVRASNQQNRWLHVVTLNEICAGGELLSVHFHGNLMSAFITVIGLACAVPADQPTLRRLPTAHS